MKLPHSSHAADAFARTALLCFVAAVTGAALVGVYFKQEKAASQTQLAEVSNRLRQMEAKAADPKEVERLRAQVREAEVFKKDAEDIHRLRGEVTALRADKAMFEQAKTENAQLRVAAQQAQRLQSENTALRGQYQTAVQTMQQAQALAMGGGVQPAQAHKNSCIANLKQIDGATQQWALENRKVANSPVEVQGFLPYLKGSRLPLCPTGGIYSPGRSVSASPTCTIPGHTL